MFSVDDINEMQKTIDRQNRIITVLKRTIKQWVKEYNILDEIIDLKDEDIAVLEAYYDVNEDFKAAWKELKVENDRLKEEITELEEKFLTLNGKSYSYYTTLQEIKALVCGNYEIIDPQGRKDILKLITKAEEQ